jgi:hypothetical protein
MDARRKKEKSRPGHGSNVQDVRISSTISQRTWRDANSVVVNEAKAEQGDGATEEYSDLSESESEAEARVNDDSSEGGSSMEGTSDEESSDDGSDGDTSW